MQVHLLILVLLLCSSAHSLALDPREADLVTIRAVLDDPQHYNLHRVRFHGRVTQISALAHQGGCGRFDAYVIRFEDETGSIEVFDVGWCNDGSSEAPLLVISPVQIGEKVSIATTIVYSTHAPGPLLRARLQWIGRLPDSLP
jgi:hypothetical protein